MKIWRNTTSTSHLTEDDALAISRETWGNSNVLATKHTGDHESYTPPEYIEAARSLMGQIDLDPASNSMAQEVDRDFFCKPIFGDIAEGGPAVGGWTSDPEILKKILTVRIFLATTRPRPRHLCLKKATNLAFDADLLDGENEAKRDFAAHYKATFQHGGDRTSQVDSSVHLGATDYCRQFGRNGGGKFPLPLPRQLAEFNSGASEIDAIRRAMEPVEKVAAKERMSEAGKGRKVSLPSQTRDKIGAFAGVSLKQRWGRRWVRQKWVGQLIRRACRI